MKKQVTMRNDDLGLETQVVESSVGVWEEHGWTVVDDETSEAEKATELDLAPEAEPQGQTGDVAPPEEEQNSKSKKPEEA